MDEPKVPEHWTRCPFCGASNGQYGRPLEQHRPRCRFKGAADGSGEQFMIPNYFCMIEEDDRTWLPLMRAAATELPETRARLASASKELVETRGELKKTQDGLAETVTELEAQREVERWARLCVADHKFYVGLADALETLDKKRSRG